MATPLRDLRRDPSGDTSGAPAAGGVGATGPEGAGPVALAGRPALLVPAVLVAAAIGLVAVAAVVDSRTSASQRSSAAAADPGSITAVVGALLVCAAAVLLAFRRRHPVGVVLAALGALWATAGVFESWAAYSLAQGLPGTDLAFWVVHRLGSALLVGVPLLLVLYPTGRLPRRRRAAAAVVAAAAALPLALLLSPDTAVFLDAPTPPGVRTDQLALPLSQEAAVAVLTAARATTLLAILAAVGLVAARHARADGLERRQLRWLLWAGIVCVLSVVALTLTGPGVLSNAVLTLAVVTTAASVTIGVVRPDLADVDALVAGTLTFAGVAGVVVAIDLAVVAAASALLGDRLVEREVTLLVLVAAVAVYGPLRSWLAAAVQRVLFGRRGDRYDAVSTLAARLEESGEVEEQLPALVAAVAATFRAPYVRVDVFTPGGGSLSAEHGTPTADTSDLPISYRGEQVGRLVLARRGVGAMLTRRDQALLVDLVRQAAIAIRGSLLARAVQDSRERLVLAREDDRRRIRRDLHDGLGPTLGGVALRLDAAGNAVEVDPERARALVITARNEVREAMDDVRRLVHGLRPPALDDLGLLAAVEQQADRVRSRLDVRVRATDVSALPAAVEVAAYRIVAEALTNVVRHAGATTADVRLAVAGPALEVEVRDDGCGIADHVTAGVGLRSLRERAEELGGRCEVTCPPGGGTRVWAWLPLGTGS